MNTLVNTLTETELDDVCGGTRAENSMIELQSLVSRRGVALHLLANMLSATNESTKSIIKNIR